MNKLASRLSQRTRIALACALGLALVVLVYFERPAALRGEGAPFRVVALSQRDMAGAPALVLAFSQPLDARADRRGFVQVYEMPIDGSGDASRLGGSDVGEADTTGGVPVAGEWVHGKNPLLLYFSNVKAQRRYVVRVAAGLPAWGEIRLPAEVFLSVRVTDAAG